MAQPLQKNRIPAKISAELINFADSLNPSASFIKEGKERVQDVFNTLQREPNLSIDRSFIGGSVGKSTSVIYPDFDCVVFMNKKYPPLTSMVDEFEKILREKAEQLKIDVKSIKKSSITISVHFINGVEMDLLPASSFTQDSEEQYKEVLKRLKENPKLSLGYSSSLAETQIQFMRNQSGPTHQLVRIAKYWYKLCTFDDYIYGGSLIMEILCVDAALDLDPTGVTFPMLEAFKLFLKKVTNVRTLKIAFFRENGKLIRVLPREFNRPKYKSHFHEQILEKKNFIIEPANPYNDLAPNIKDTSFKRLQDFSKKMLARLEKLESTQTNEMKTLSPDGSSVALVHYGELFKPFIMRLKDCYPNSAIPTYICVDYIYQNYNTAHVNAEVRQVAFDFFKNNKLAKNVYKTVMNNLLFLIRGKAMRAMNKGLSFCNGVTVIEKVDDVKAAVKAFIDANFAVKEFMKESSSNKDHQTYFVTLSIPYSRMGNIYAVRFSMKWKI